MADMTASGWYPSNVVVISKSRPWGPGGTREVIFRFRAQATNFGDGAHVYPGEGIPVPDASLLGFREYISYIQPVSPFFRSDAAGKMIIWGCHPVTGGASGGTVSTGARIRLFSPRVSGSASAAAGVDTLQCVSTLAASDIFSPTGTAVVYTAFGRAVGK